MTHPPVCLHPENPKILLFRGAPLLLITATEHYGAVLNRPFRFERYLADVAARGITLTRLFTLFRELQAPKNPYSTCKPESPDYVAPFIRSGAEAALDGQPKYDLDRWNPEFFTRLDAFLSLASEYGIVVEVTLFSNTYKDGVWALNPLHPANNLDDSAPVAWYEYTSQRHAGLFRRQCAHVTEIVRRTNRFDNVIYEICNEPGGNAFPAGPSRPEVDAWQMEIARVIRETEQELPNRHLISAQEAFAYHLDDESERRGPGVFQFADRGFTMDAVDIVNMHPADNMRYRGRSYDLGEFMQGNLKLAELQRYCLDLYAEPKPLNLDEDNSASQYKNTMGWTVHRKRAWTALFCGAHYDAIDFSIVNGFETGTEESRHGLRAWFGHLARFIHGLDLVRARPMPELIGALPEHIVGSVLAIPGECYELYLADCRERDEPGAGEMIAGQVVLDLADRELAVSCYSPETGLESPAVRLQGGSHTRLELPPFKQDLVVRIKRSAAAGPTMLPMNSAQPTCCANRKRDSGSE